MAHNIDNRQRRERRQRRAYMKSLRRLAAFDRKAGPSKKDSPERFEIWLKGWRARHPADARTPEGLARVYAQEIAPPKPKPPKAPKAPKQPKEPKEPAEAKKPAEPKEPRQPKPEKKAKGQ